MIKKNCNAIIYVEVFMKKVISALLVACLALSTLAGCTKSGKDDGTQIDKSQQTQAVTNEPVTVKVFRPMSWKLNEDNELIKKEIAKKSGINIEFMVASSNQSEWKQKLNLMLASGDIPDTMVIDADTYYEYANQGVFSNVTDKIKDYPNLVKYITPEIFERIKVGGNVYGIPNINTKGKLNLYIRKDWLDKLNLQPPKTLEEFYNVAKAFTENDPDGNGQKDTVGFGQNGGYFTQFIEGAYGINSGYYTLNKDNEIVTGSISDSYKKSLEFTKKMIDAGYVDKETFVMKSEQFRDKFIQGKIGMFAGWWSDAHVYAVQYKMYETNPEAEILAIDLPAGPNNQKGMPAWNELGGMVGISKNIKDADAALKMCDFLVSDEGWKLSMVGIENLHWKQENGKVTFVADSAKKDLNGKPVQDILVYMLLMKKELYPNYQLAGDSIESTIARANYTKADNNPLISDLFVGLSTKESAQYKADVVKYESEMKLKFLLGQESLDNWGKYVNEWKKRGGEEVRNSLLNAYNQKYGTKYIFAD